MNATFDKNTNWPVIDATIGLYQDAAGKRIKLSLEILMLKKSPLKKKIKYNQFLSSKTSNQSKLRP